jgi:chemotaxis protein MotB
VAKSKRGEESGGSTDANGWMVTFSDLLTLLMTFFVMLLSMSSMDKNRLEGLSASLRGAVGVLESGLYSEVSAPKEISHKIAVGKSLAFEVRNALAELKIDQGKTNDTEETGYMGQGVSVVEEGSKVWVSLPEAILFPRGSKTLSSHGMRVVEKIGKVLKRWTYPIRCQGHTDGSGEVSEAEALPLSLQRAASVVNHLRTRAAIPDKRLIVVGYGSMRPIDTSGTEAGRARNRRVDLVVVTDPEG